MIMLEFKQKVLCIGFGSVGKCALPILLEHIRIPYKNITVLDFADKTQGARPLDQERRPLLTGKTQPRQCRADAFQVRLPRQHDHRSVVEYRLSRHAFLVP